MEQRSSWEANVAKLVKKLSLQYSQQPATPTLHKAGWIQVTPSHSIPSKSILILFWNQRLSISQDNSICIAKDYGLDKPGSIPNGGKKFSLLYSIQTWTGAHAASYLMLIPWR